jgi:ComF family protein
MSRNLVQKSRKILRGLLDTALPPRCILSGEIVALPGTLSPGAWQSLRFISPPCCQTCGYPFDFAIENTTLCAACLADPPPFASARSVLVYDDASRDLILKFKHADQLQAVPTLVPMLARAGAQGLDQAEVIIPVPLHRWRFLKRRYNQAALLAWGVSRSVRKPCIPDALLRIRPTPSQGHKRARDRAENVRKAFAVNPRHQGALAGQSVMLVDDVYTTGATLRECAATLIKAGAREVHILTVARVVRVGQG